MESTNEKTIERSSFLEQIKQFLTKMEYSNAQRAMFFLGRMLSAVSYMQKDKKKTVLEKVNFSGMDKDDIVRLRLALVEKAKQYQSVEKLIFTDQEFGKHFDFKNWDMNPQEAVFFLLTGYSYGAGVKNETSDKNDSQTSA